MKRMLECVLFGKVKVTGTAGSSVIGAGKHRLPELLGSCIGQRDIGEANLSCSERPSVCGKSLHGVSCRSAGDHQWLAIFRDRAII